MGKDVITIKYEFSIEEIFDIRSLHIVSYLSGNIIGL